ncbi:PRC-barrel domain-containing protein [Muricoccus vinaceus]|uniref:PRC-barrel domain-containing protein n=1 Tax=Muricoccus vinaceus TaxID=424704 RepID=A0ABV6IU49_9PROT
MTAPRSGANDSLPGWGGTPAPQAGSGTTGGGLVTVAPGAVVIPYYTVQTADMTAGNLMRTEVRNLQDERIGRIEDLVIGNGREVTAVVIGVGGFLGIGERFAAVPPSAVVLTRSPDGLLRAVVDATRDQLRSSPEFRFDGNLRR